MALANRVMSSAALKIDAAMLRLSICHGTSKRHDPQDYVMGPTDPMWKLMDFICERWDISRDDARFFRDGERIHQYDTMESLEMQDGDRIDFFKQQLGGKDNMRHQSIEAPDQMNESQSLQSPCGIAQNQTGFVESAQHGVDAGEQTGSQITAFLPAGNAGMEGRGGLPNDYVDRNTIQDIFDLTLNVPTKENTPATPQTSRKQLSIAVTDKNCESQLIFTVKPETPMRKVMLNVCARLGAPWDLSCFSHAGRRINPDDTSASLCLKDMDQIKLHIEPTGGADTTGADLAAANRLPNQTDNLHSTKAVNTGNNEQIRYIQSDKHASDAQPSRDQDVSADRSVAGCPQIAQTPPHVTIRVVDMNGLNELEFQMGTSTPMGKLIPYVCERWGISELTVRFMFLGARLQKNEIPSMLDMEDGDRIEVFHEHHGGDASQSVSHDVDQSAKQIVNLSFRLSVERVERDGAQNEDTERAASNPQESGEKEPKTNEGLIISPRSPQRYLHIQVFFAGPNGLKNATYRISPRTTMGEIMRHARHHLMIPEHSSRFLYEGMRLGPEETAFELMMADGDRIAVFGPQLS